MKRVKKRKYSRRNKKNKKERRLKKIEKKGKRKIKRQINKEKVARVFFLVAFVYIIIKGLQSNSNTQEYVYSLLLKYK